MRKRLPKKNQGWYLFLSLMLIGLVAIGFIKLVRGILTVLVTKSFKTNLVLVVKDQISWVNIDEENKKVIIFEIPKNMMIGVVGMKGDLKAGSLWKFGVNEHKPLEITKRSIELMFGALSDGIIYIDADVDNINQALRQSLWMVGTKSDLGLTRRIAIYTMVVSLSEAQIDTVKIPQALGLIEKLPDGSEVIRLDRQRLDLVVDDHLVEEAVLESTARITILNQSGLPGMSKLAERQLKNVGGLVVEVKEGSISNGWCSYLASKETLKENVGLEEWLKYKMKCRLEKSETEIESGEIELKLNQDWGEAYSR